MNTPENVIITQDFASPCGELILGEFNGKICLCDWKYRSMRPKIDSRIQAGLSAIYQPGKSTVLEQLKTALEQYFRREITEFNLPLLTVGSAFQKTIWKALQQVPYGKTESYGELAKRAGHPEAVRAVGSANGANAISILIPCHRIIGSSGTLGGYAGGLHAKKKLLELEAQPILDNFQ